MVQPRIRCNDYGTLPVPEPGEWLPRKSVSVVIPAYRCDETLPLALASLAGQSYPSHLLEVVVVDTGGAVRLSGPGPVPERTRVVRVQDGGEGVNARQRGAAVAEGDVVHWLDADVVLDREHIETQMRWHHLAGYLVVLGQVRFHERRAGVFTASEVEAAVVSGTAAKLFGEDEGVPHQVMEMWERTGDLRQAGSDAFTGYVGTAASLPADLFRSVGGLDVSLPLGHDAEFAFRLAQAGAVFVADRRSVCHHLGGSAAMRRRRESRRHTMPYITERIPHYRSLRNHPNRQYLVPNVEAVVDASGRSAESVQATVNGLLAGRMSDVSVTLVGPWGLLAGEQRFPLDDPSADLRLIRESFRGEARVRFAERPAETAFPVPFRFTCPAGWVPRPDALERLLKFADDNALGLVSLVLEEGEEMVAARLERTAAVRRALLLAAPGEEIGDVMHQVSGTVWEDGLSWGLRPMGATDDEPAVDPEIERWKRKVRYWRRQARLLRRQLDRTPRGRIRGMVAEGLRLVRSRRQAPGPDPQTADRAIRGGRRKIER
ncbi:hypothetical protein GCM10010466_48460 [Planomonospora alba]|uniref:Glycosyltransferase 2-like domain-containing protein n=2 Tax=Planomonospora alba TaxID=161354 RepID=A0ABP6NLE7_9ACTN